MLGVYPSANCAGVFAPEAARREARDLRAERVRADRPDDTVTVIAAHSEMGQGIYTGLAMIVAEELDCDWRKVRVEPAPADAVYNHTAFGVQMTGGSSSTWTEFERSARPAPPRARCSSPPRPRLEAVAPAAAPRTAVVHDDKEAATARSPAAAA